MIIRILLFAIASSIFSFNVYSQDAWTSIDYQTSGTGENGLVGQYVLCFMDYTENDLWIGTGSGISVWNNSDWESYTTNEGLKVNSVADLVKDNDNNIWIGYGSYYAGVSKFDGSNFIHYNQTNGLVHDKVNDIIKDNEGNIWFATMGGISKYYDSNWDNFTTVNGLPEANITCIEKDSKGNIVFGTTNNGTWIYNGTDFEEFSWETNSTKYISNIYTDKSGKIWVVSSSGVYIYDGEWSRFTYDNTKISIICDIIEDQNGNFFFANSKGVALYDGISWAYFTTEDGLQNNNTFSLYVNSQNQVYSGSERGISIYDGEIWQGITTVGLINNDVNAIFKDANEDIWFCTQGGISILKGDVWESFSSTPDGEDVEWVSDGLQDNNGNYWFTTVHGIYMYDGVNWEIFNGEVNDIYSGWGQDILQDTENNIWFATWNYLLKYDGENWTSYNETDGFLSNYIEGLYQDANDNIWIGTRAGITKWDGSEFTHYIIDNPSFYGASINSFIEDSQGVLYATSNIGIFIFQEDNWTFWQEAPLIWYQDSYKDKNDILWFASTEGLYKFDGTTFTSYLEDEGLIGNVIQDIYREEDSSVFWFATSNGVSKLVPDVVAEVSNNKSYNSYSIQVNSEGITKPFQFSIDGISFEKNDGIFQNLEEGNYEIYITNAYDTLIINHTIENVTSINGITDNLVTVFPNPSAGKIYFNCAPQNIEIYNLGGSKLMQLPKLGKENNIDLSNFENGIYFVQFIYNEKLYRKTIVKIAKGLSE